jgi:hypothetical protein
VLALLLKENLLDKITPAHFITIATPHLGSRSKTRGMKSVMAKLLLDQTGKDLMLLPREDGQVILMDLTDEERMKPLEMFGNLVTYSCSRRNSQVDYQSSAIRRNSLGNQVDLSDQSPPLLIMYENDSEEDLTATTLEDQMLAKLNKLNWKRMALIPPASQDYEIMNNSFWASKISLPMISNIVEWIKNTMQPSISLETVASVKSSAPVHLVVLIHGLDGFSSDMEYIATRLKERYPESIRTLSPECNHGRTYDGIMNGASRILQCVKNEIKRGDIKYLSIIGHSLGGLYGRCLVGLLSKEDIIPNFVTPVNFITMATPHLGSREHAKILGEKFTSLVVGSAIGLTGKGMRLIM